MKKRILGIILMVVLFVPLLVNAENLNSEASVNFETNKKTFNVGETFDVKINAYCANGINGFNGQIDYNKDKFELKGIKAIDSQKWVVLQGENEAEINILCNSQKHETKADLVNVTFQVRDSANVGEEVISLNNVKIDSDASENSLISIDNKTLLLSIEHPLSSPPIQEKANNTSNEKMPNTGKINHFVLVIVIVILILISYIKYRKYNKIKKTL